MWCTRYLWGYPSSGIQAECTSTKAGQTRETSWMSARSNCEVEDILVEVFAGLFIEPSGGPGAVNMRLSHQHYSRPY
jgi:hypothetical protein